MIGGIILFLTLAVLIYFGIRRFQKMTGAQALFLTKAGMYTVISGTLAILLVLGIVFLF
jgi:hypothetical protein